ncbi:hypothetical protein [Paracerasibacillus soli]|uniref:Butyrate kinase n=1 Tax=Paracerasibacillus soli TaxID=480284 RepID=A0ABU5CSN3_9BACI|nr:hypothetical protein [Virgibacillus soli]MDY0409336.1 hypothetical protein [Virgibacillus soli]
MRAVCMQIAEEELKKPYEESNLIVAHIGGEALPVFINMEE